MTETAPVLTYGRKAGSGSTDSMAEAASETEERRIVLTESAARRIATLKTKEDAENAFLRIAVSGGGCSGFSYSMSFENASGLMDKVFDMDGLKVYVDATSVMYLNGCIVDYVETLEGAGFKFENPNVKSTCGCGSSFSV